MFFSFTFPNFLLFFFVKDQLLAIVLERTQADNISSQTKSQGEANSLKNLLFLKTLKFFKRWLVFCNTRCQLLCRRDASYASSAKGWRKTEQNEDENCRNKWISWVRTRLVRENCSNQPGCCLKKHDTEQVDSVIYVAFVYHCCCCYCSVLFWIKIIIQLYFGFSKDLSQSLT